MVSLHTAYGWSRNWSSGRTDPYPAWQFQNADAVCWDADNPERNDCAPNTNTKWRMVGGKAKVTSWQCRSGHDMDANTHWWIFPSDLLNREAEAAGFSRGVQRKVDSSQSSRFKEGIREKAILEKQHYVYTVNDMHDGKRNVIHHQAILMLAIGRRWVRINALSVNTWN